MLWSRHQDQNCTVEKQRIRKLQDYHMRLKPQTDIGHSPVSCQAQPGLVAMSGQLPKHTNHLYCCWLVGGESSAGSSDDKPVQPNSERACATFACVHGDLGEKQEYLLPVVSRCDAQSTDMYMAEMMWAPYGCEVSGMSSVSEAACRSVRLRTASTRQRQQRTISSCALCIIYVTGYVRAYVVTALQMYAA